MPTMATAPDPHLLAEHQKGVCGHLRIRADAAQLRGRRVSCAYGAETAVLKGKTPSFFVAVRKGAFSDGSIPPLVIEAPRADDDRPNRAAADVSTLLSGEESVLEARAEPDGPRFWVEYLPYGLEPERGDVVRLEPFAAFPSVLDVIPAAARLDVDDASDGGVTVAWDHAPEGGGGEPWRCVARLRRSAVFVARRDTWADTLLHQPVAALMDTETGRRVEPVARHAGDLLRPAVLATKLAWQSISAVGGAVFAEARDAYGPPPPT